LPLNEIGARVGTVSFSTSLEDSTLFGVAFGFMTLTTDISLLSNKSLMLLSFSGLSALTGLTKLESLISFAL